MISRLRGTLIEKTPPGLVIDVQGVGYELDASMTTHYALPMTGEPVELFTHMVVREDAQLLFGFATRSEKRLFRLLLSVNGVGAKVALSILSGMTSDEFLACVASNDATRLTKVPGIGKKTAERLVFDLKDKVEASMDVGAGGASVNADSGSVRTQAENALMALGYKQAEAAKLLESSAAATATGNSGDEQSVEEMIRGALRSISR